MGLDRDPLAEIAACRGCRLKQHRAARAHRQWTKFAPLLDTAEGGPPVCLKVGGSHAQAWRKLMDEHKRVAVQARCDIETLPRSRASKGQRSKSTDGKRHGAKRCGWKEEREQSQSRGAAGKRSLGPER